MPSSKKCSKQFICFDKYIIVANIFFILFLAFLFYNLKDKKERNSQYNDDYGFPWKNIMSLQENRLPSRPDIHLSNDLNYDFHNYVLNNNRENANISNPFIPPLKPLWMQSPQLPIHNHIHSHGHTQLDAHANHHIPINVSTSYEQYPYRQVGILRRSGILDDSRERATILSLLGRPLHKSRNKWQYYTMTDKSNGIKLPIKIKRQGKPCSSNFISTLSSYGCNELNSGDIVTVDGYNTDFIVTIYDSDTLQYI